ncbi:MAG: hypothetical protein IPL08_13260 [Saprospiraceae bacterium]|nr:hypothetical protein [Saprospiraceae bacterium]
MNLIFTERQNQVAYYICGKIYTHFVSPVPNTEFIAELSKLFIQSAWELLRCLKHYLKAIIFMMKY